jgi:hypothetical protein
MSSLLISRPIDSHVSFSFPMLQRACHLDPRESTGVNWLASHP